MSIARPTTLRWRRFLTRLVALLAARSRHPQRGAHGAAAKVSRELARWVISMPLAVPRKKTVWSPTTSPPRRVWMPISSAVRAPISPCALVARDLAQVAPGGLGQRLGQPQRRARRSVPLVRGGAASTISRS